MLGIILRKTFKIVVPLLVFIMLFGVIKNSVLYVIYKADNELFVNMFCQNKDKPQLHCNGKCKLTDVLQEQKKEASRVLKQLQKEVLFCTSTQNIDFLSKQILNVDKQDNPMGELHVYAFLFITKSDKPPEPLQIS